VGGSSKQLVKPAGEPRFHSGVAGGGTPASASAAKLWHRRASHSRRAVLLPHVALKAAWLHPLTLHGEAPSARKRHCGR
jgi:hypothetical protein